MARDEAVLLDVVRAAQLVLEFRQGIDRVAFFDDLKRRRRRERLTADRQSVNAPGR
jgi:hypothetical protein